MKTLMKTYAVFAQCKTRNCKGEVEFGTTNAEPNDLLEQVRAFPPQKGTCPICQQTADYTGLNYTARPLETPDNG